MRKKKRALSGAAQDAYFRRVLKAHPTLPADERSRLLNKLRQEVAQVHLRAEPRDDAEKPSDVLVAGNLGGPPPVTTVAANEVPTASSVGAQFDPFSPNVIVVVRKAGRDAALAELGAIDSADNLRLLAREQRLTVDADLSSVAELRAAIVAAAERRIANRMAAAT